MTASKAVRRDVDSEAVTEDLTFLAHHGIGATEAARRTGFSGVKALDQWARRHDQVALLNQLTTQDIDPLTPSRRHTIPARTRKDTAA